MRALGLLLVVCSIGCSTTSGARENPPSTASVGGSTGGVVNLHVNGMACPLCATNVKKSLERVDGVQTARVDLAAGVVRVEMKEGAGDRAAELQAAVVNAGFSADRVERAP